MAQKMKPAKKMRLKEKEELKADKKKGKKK